MSSSTNPMKSSPPSSVVPDPTPFLFLVGATLAWFAIGSDAGPAWILTAVVALPFLIWLGRMLASRPESGVILLVAAAAMPRGFVEIGGLKARPEHLAVGLLCVAVPLLIRARHLTPQWILADYVLASYVAANLVSSLFMSVEPAQTLRWSLQQAVAILPYFFMRVVAGNFKALRWSFRVFLIVGVAEAAFATFCFYSNLVFGTEFGMEVGQYGDIPGTFGTQYEANILGSYCGACAIVLLAMYFYYRRRDLLLGYTIAFSGMAISLSRGALAATATGFMVLMFCSWRMKRLHRSALFAAGAATLGALLVLTPALMSRYAERFKNVSVSEPAADDNTLTRVVLFSMAAEGIVAHPVLGNGTSSFQLLVTQEDVPFYSDVFWISNTELRILHDTGVIGFSLFAVFLGMIISKALKTLRRRFRPELLGLLIGLAVYAVSFQFTEGTLLAFAWIHAGLLACFVVVQRIDGPNNELELS